MAKGFFFFFFFLFFFQLMRAMLEQQTAHITTHHRMPCYSPLSSSRTAWNQSASLTHAVTATHGLAPLEIHRRGAITKKKIIIKKDILKKDSHWQHGSMVHDD